jgi:hypothetical protein
MSPTRIGSSGSAFERRLVGAARTEAPPEGAEARARAAIERSLAPAGASSASGTRWRSTHWPAVLKVVTLGAAIALGGVAVILAGRVARTRRTPVESPAVGGAAESPGIVGTIESPRLGGSVEGTGDTGAGVAAAASGDRPAVRSSPVATFAAPPRRRAVPPSASAATFAPRPSATAPSTNTRPDLATEIALVQQAKRALAEGDASVALGVLDVYDRTCPQGILAEEAGLVRVRALEARGDATAARALAARLLASDPQGVLAPQLRSISNGTNPPATSASGSSGKGL